MVATGGRYIKGYRISKSWNEDSCASYFRLCHLLSLLMRRHIYWKSPSCISAGKGTSPIKKLWFAKSWGTPASIHLFSWSICGTSETRHGTKLSEKLCKWRLCIYMHCWCCRFDENNWNFRRQGIETWREKRRADVTIFRGSRQAISVSPISEQDLVSTDSVEANTGAPLAKDVSESTSEHEKPFRST